MIGVSLLVYEPDPDEHDDEGLPLFECYPTAPTPELQAARMTRIDRGEECPCCHRGKAQIERGLFGRVTQFRCCNCGAEWFDSLTTPTQGSAS